MPVIVNERRSPRPEPTLPTLTQRSSSPPPRVRAAARTDRGRVRERNEEHYLIGQAERTLGILNSNVNAHTLGRLHGCPALWLAVAARAGSSLEDWAEALPNDANAAGGRDNVTVVLARCVS